MNYEHPDTDALIDIIHELQKQVEDLYETNYLLRMSLDDHISDIYMHETSDRYHPKRSNTDFDAIRKSLERITFMQDTFSDRLMKFSSYSSHHSTDYVLDYAKKLQYEIDDIRDNMDDHMREHRTYDARLSTGSIVTEERLYSIRELLEQYGITNLFVVRDFWTGDF